MLFSALELWAAILIKGILISFTLYFTFVFLDFLFCYPVVICAGSSRSWSRKLYKMLIIKSCAGDREESDYRDIS